MLESKDISNDLNDFLNRIKNQEKLDQEAAIREYADNFEKIIYKAIKNLEIHIPAGTIKVAGTSSNQVNPSIIVLKGVMLK